MEISMEVAQETKSRTNMILKLLGMYAKESKSHTVEIPVNPGLYKYYTQ
jgi:hypothetical protein